MLTILHEFFKNCTTLNINSMLQKIIFQILLLWLFQTYACVCACDREGVSYNIIAFANNNLMQKLALSVSLQKVPSFFHG